MRKVFVAVALLLACSFCFSAGSRYAWAETASVEPEVVTGSRIYTELSEIPAPTYVITAEEIAVSGVTDLGTLLDRNIPGVFMKKKTGVSQQSEVVIRGITTEILVLVDGIPYYRSSHLADGATVDLRSFPLENIERVEVVKGGGSAIYGSMAAGGVINIITKKPVASGGMILAEAGSNDWRRYYVSGNAVGDDLSAGIWYERTEEGRRRLFYDTVPENRFDSLEYMGDAYGLVLRGSRWVLRATTGEFRYKYLTPGWGQDPADLNDERKEYRRYSFRYDADSWYLLTGYDTQRYEILQNAGNFYEDSAFTAEFGGRSAMGEALVAWGIYYRYEETEFSDGWGDPAVSKDRFNLAPFLEVSYPAGDWLVNLGLRYEVWRQEANDHEELVPKISIQRQFANGNIFYLAASRVFAMPSFYEMYAESSWTAGNPDLKPEKGWSYETGIKGPDEYSWSAGIFYTGLEDKIKSVYDPGIYKYTYLNLADFRTYGVEISRSWKLAEKWVFSLNGTWQYPEEKQDTSSPWVRSYGVPEWEIGGALKFSTGPWKMILDVSWAGNRAGNAGWYDWDAGDYVLVDLAVSWGSDDDTITLFCYNLLDEEYTYNSAGWHYFGPERGFRLKWERRF